MRSILLLMLGIPIPIVILIALFVHWDTRRARPASGERSGSGWRGPALELLPWLLDQIAIRSTMFRVW